MFPDDPPTHRIYTFAEVKAVPEPIPMQLLVLGVPNKVPFALLYVCQPPYVDPLVPTRVVQVRPDVDNVPEIVEFPVMVIPPLDTVSPASEVNPVHIIDFVVSIPIPN